LSVAAKTYVLVAFSILTLIGLVTFLKGNLFLGDRAEVPAGQNSLTDKGNVGFEKDATDSARSRKSLYPNNDELASAHIRVSPDGNVYLPNDIEMEFSKNFTFPDGDTISIIYRVVNWFDESIDSSIDDGITPNFFENLQQAALEGNDQAAIHAYKETSKCMFGGDYETLVSNSAESPSNPQQALNFRCSELKEGATANALTLLRNVAERGNPTVQEFYARIVTKSDPVEARKYFKILWDKGYSWGIGGMRETTPSMTNLDFDQKVETEAYAYVSYAIAMAYYDGVPSEVIQEHKESILAAQRDRQNQNSPPIEQAAQKLAKKLLTENVNCCVTHVHDQFLLEQ